MTFLFTLPKDSISPTSLLCSHSPLLKLIADIDSFRPGFDFNLDDPERPIIRYPSDQHFYAYVETICQKVTNHSPILQTLANRKANRDLGRVLCPQERRFLGDTRLS